MSEMGSPVARAPKRRRPGGPRRWTAADKTRYLAAFAKSGVSIKAFCAEAGVPRATFTLWQYQARRTAAKRASTRRTTPSFARVEVVPPGAPAGITLVIRANPSVVAELAGLDAITTVSVLRAVLPRRKR